ncbi:MAG TPA: hypothetical protein VN376_04535 [Longilinea sp.]|nr:hypothetical protein [Longilinea sp.]
MFIVLFSVSTGMVDNTIFVIGRRIERIQLKRGITSINDVVIRPNRDNHCKSSSM